MKGHPPPAAATSGSLSRQVAESLAASIKEGIFPVGSRLPPEHELARRYGVSRHTVRQAFGMLRAEGIIASRQGLGTVVVRDAADLAYTETYSSIEELTSHAQGHPIRVDTIEDVIADAALAELLRCAEGQAFLCIKGRRYDSTGRIEDPVCHVTVYVDARFQGIRSRIHALNNAIVDAIEAEFGHAVSRITQEIRPAVISAEIAGLLNVEAGSAALSLSRWYHGTDERVFEIAFSYYPLGRFTYRTELIRRRRV